MNKENRVCPKCGVEYYSHIIQCADCNVELVNEVPIIKKEVFNMEKASLISQGVISTLKPLIQILDEMDIPYKLKFEGQEIFTELSPVSDFSLFVPTDKINLITEIINKEINDEFPELLLAEELIDSGKCPACGHNCGENKTCPDCGLPLVIDMDEI
jgi:hypothetical protein